MPMTVAPTERGRDKDVNLVPVNRQPRRKYLDTDGTYRKYFNLNLPKSVEEEFVMPVNYYEELIKQEIELREHNAKRVAMETFDLQYSAYVILCNYISCMNKPEISEKQLLKQLNNAETLMKFGAKYDAWENKKGKYTKAVKKVTAKFEHLTVKEVTGYIEWAYRAYKAKMAADPNALDKKTRSCLKLYKGLCEKCCPHQICEATKLCKGCKKLKIAKNPLFNKSGCGYKIEHLGKEYVLNKVPASCKACNNTRLDKEYMETTYEKVVRRRRLGDSAAYLLDRHHQIHGVRISPVLATLLEEIEEAQRNWRPRRR